MSDSVGSNNSDPDARGAADHPGNPDDPPDPPDPHGTPGAAALARAEERLARAEERLREVEKRMPPPWQAALGRFRERIRSQPLLDATWRVGVFALGTTLVGAGLVMFVVPGPGFATVILGLVVLGSEFAWASRALDPVKSAASRASQAALDPRRRRAILTAAAAAGVVAGILLIWYLGRYGLTIAPVVQIFAAVTAWARGLFS